jgi:hypothetical protein
MSIAHVIANLTLPASAGTRVRATMTTGSGTTTTTVNGRVPARD